MKLQLVSLEELSDVLGAQENIGGAPRPSICTCAKCGIDRIIKSQSLSCEQVQDLEQIQWCLGGVDAALESMTHMPTALMEKSIEHLKANKFPLLAQGLVALVECSTVVKKLVREINAEREALDLAQLEIDKIAPSSAPEGN